VDGKGAQVDLRSYYRKIRETEGGISAPFVVVISLATPEGGKPGTATEVSRHIAAKLVVEGRARVATDEESKQFHEEQLEGRRAAEAAAAAQRMQVTIVPSEFRGKPAKSAKEQ
jgi:hypothetical protein